MANNFMRQLLGGIQQTYGQAERNVYDRVASEDKFAQEKQLLEQEQLQKQQLQEKDTNVIGSLLTGKMTIHGDPEKGTYERDMTDQDRQRIAMNLSPEGLRRYGNILKIGEDEDPGKTQYRTLGGAIYKIDPETGLDPKPIIQADAKVVGTHWGKNEETGQYGFFKIYDNGEFTFDDPGMMEPVRGSGKTTEKNTGPLTFADFDNKQLTAWLNQKTDQLNAIESKKAQYREIFGYDRAKKKPGLRTEVNNLAEDGALSVYTMMPEDTKAIADEIMGEITAYATANKMSTKQFMDKYKDTMKKELQASIQKSWDEKKIDNIQARVLQQYIKFKFGYLAEGE